MKPLDSLALSRYTSPCGDLLLGARSGGLVCCSWLLPQLREQGAEAIERALQAPKTAEDEALLRESARQLDAYFRGQRRDFDLPLALSGTPFQLALWQALGTIPYGVTRTYGSLAEQIGHPRAFQAVGTATGANPLAIIIPCHRVVGKQGAFSGYRGGRTAKEYLLRLEERISGRGVQELFDQTED